jgi:S-DNA-T family DNA segregation ATPase FtsK/SpoIIIE
MSEILARTAVRIAALVLERNKGAEHQCVRIKNLDAEEVIRFVDAWPAISTVAGLHKVRLVVADDLGGRISSDHVAEPGCTITHYRNHNRQGLVYVETRIQSDEQGLQNMFTLRDSNFLDKSFDEHASVYRGIPGLLVQEAWYASGGKDRVPALLLDRLLTVLDHVHPGVVSVSVRRFVDYAEQVCRAWLGYTKAIDGACADRMIGESLWALEKMFPDAQWHEGGSDVRCRRRLAMNFRHADLMDGAVELTAEDISAKARSVRFARPDGKPFSVPESQAWAELCDQYGRDRSLRMRRQLPYEIFSQLFARDTAGLKLGDRIRVEIESAALDRLVEFDSLDLTAGLNARSNHAAVQLQEATPPPGCCPLIDLASAKTRKSIERLAVPPRRRFLNPASEIVRQTQRVQADLQDERIARLVVDLVDGGEDISRNPSVGLFAFLFGSTLESIASECDGMSGGCQLLIDERLLRQHKVPPRPGNDDDDAVEDVGDDLAWNPVALKFIFMDASGNTLEVVDQLEWCPAAIEHFALLWLLAVAPGSPALTCVGTLRVQHVADVENWLAPLVSRQSDLAELTTDPDHELADPGPLMREFVQMRLALKESFSNEGISISVLQTFLDSWYRLLLEARQQFIPDGVRIRELESFLGTDLLQVGGSERRMMLAFHPIRLRWIRFYLEQTRKLACDFLSGEAAFADGEGRFYLDWLEDLTPRESPPVAVGYQGQLLYSRSEIAWCDDFSPQRTDTGDISCDDEAIASISARISNYLEAHPYKRDGLSLLVVLPTSDTVPAEILRRVMSGANRSVRISIVVAVPKRRWEAIARAVEVVAGDDGDAPRTRLFPDLDLSLVDYDSGGSLGNFLSDQQIDIAVVTHVLQEQIISQQNTEAPTEHAGAFDPLGHRPLRIETGSGGSMSLVMLPKYSDPVLESWSTLVVRSNRCKPVAPGQPENTDLIELRVSFQDSARLFHDLHAHCHWVITLERHITREQIESIEAGEPDVLSIEDGVGANRLSTLIVSSRTGRDLVRSRLVRKLQRLLPSGLDVGQDMQRLAGLADGVYESTRRFSPRLALQALGVARFTEEIIGLTVARHLADERFPVCVVSGISAWLSLDEHVGWFGGSDQVRADMCRLSLELCADGSIAADVLVLEGKLRQSYDAHGVLQVRRTGSFFRSILGGQGVDAAMWREILASAIESVAHDAVRVWVDDAHGVASDSIRERTLSALRIGPVSLRGVVGVYSICLWDCDDEHVRTDQDGDVVILQSGRCHLVNLLSERSSLAVDAPRGAGLEDLMPPDNTSSCEVVVVMKEPPPADSDLGVTFDNEDESGDQVPPISDVVSEDAGLIKPSPLRHRLSEEVLRRIYDSVLGCFDLHGVSVSAVRPEEEPFLEGPASILFKVRPAAGIDPRKLFEKGAALKLSLSLAQEQNVSFGIDRGVVTIDVPKSQEQRYFVDAAETWLRWKRPESGLVVPIGEDRFGELVELNFSSSNSPHLLVAGTTGSGKSEALNTILFGLVRHYGTDELRLMLVDPKGTELAPFENSRYLEGQIGWDDADAFALLVSAVEEMQRRYVLFRESARRSLIEYNAVMPAEKRLPWWLIVLDEYADLTHDPQSKKAIESELKRLAQKARAAGIHVIIATQKPSAEVISTNLRSNLPSQLALRVKSAIESRVVIDEAGAENLNGKGDALLKADGRLQRIQCSRVDSADMSAATRTP